MPKKKEDKQEEPKLKDLKKSLSKASKDCEHNIGLTPVSEHMYSVLLGVKDKLEYLIKEIR